MQTHCVNCCVHVFLFSVWEEDYFVLSSQQWLTYLSCQHYTQKLHYCLLSAGADNIGHVNPEWNWLGVVIPANWLRTTCIVVSTYIFELLNKSELRAENERFETKLTQLLKTGPQAQVIKQDLSCQLDIELYSRAKYELIELPQTSWVSLGGCGFFAQLVIKPGSQAYQCHVSEWYW